MGRLHTFYGNFAPVCPGFCGWGSWRLQHRRVLAPEAPGLEYFAAAAASFFLDAQKEAKEAPGVGAEGQNRLRRPCPNVAHPLDPLFTGAAN